MDTLVLKGTEDTPSITLDHVNCIYEFSGRSLPEDVTVFYKPVMDWFQEYASTPSGNLCISFKLEYFNTASSKIILDILMKLEKLKESGSDISVKWFYDPNDEDMLEAGEEYKDLVELDFEILPR